MRKWVKWTPDVAMPHLDESILIQVEFDLKILKTHLVLVLHVLYGLPNRAASGVTEQAWCWRVIQVIFAVPRAI